MLTYLASPYTHPTPAIRAGRYRAAVKALADLAQAGLTVYSPIVHWHPPSLLLGNSCDGKFYAKQDAPLLAAATHLVVLMLDGWQTSAGMAHEIGEAHRRGMPVWYLAEDYSPDDVAELAKEWGE